MNAKQLKSEYGVIKYHKGRKLIYEIPCQSCGEIVFSSQFSRNKNYLCDHCKHLIKEKEKISIDTGGTKSQIRFDKAVKKIQKQVDDFQIYEKAIKIAESRIDKYGSIPEVMVAIELIKNKHLIIPQQKIGRYKVDFALPKEKLVIEVDGKIYHRNIEEEAERDFSIKLSLGTGWKVIHIPAEKIEKNIEKLDLIINSLMEIQKI